MFRQKLCRDPKVFFPQDTMIDMFTFSLHVWNDTFTKDPQQWIWTRESHLTKQAPQTIRSYLFGLARDHLALAITTNVVAWLVGLFWGEKTPKVLEFAAPKKTTKKQDRRNMGSNRMKHGIQQVYITSLKKTVFRSDVSFTKSILYCPFLRGFPSLSNQHLSTYFFFWVAWLGLNPRGLKLRFATFISHFVSLQCIQLRPWKNTTSQPHDYIDRSFKCAERDRKSVV